MYKLLNKLFGWDYIQWKNSCDCGISRVHVDGDGTVFYWRYRSVQIADKIHRIDDVLWLTCKSEKYLKKEK